MELKQYSQEETIGQTENPKWIEARNGRLTASKFYEICHTRDMERLCKRYHKSKYTRLDYVSAIAYGMEMEPYVYQQVSNYLERVEKSPVSHCGLFIHPKYNYIAASPDGLIGQSSVLEIKCPFSMIDKPGLPYYLTQNQKTGLYELDKNHRYYYQIQGQLMCSQRKYAVLAVYHKMDEGDRIYLSCIDYDKQFCDIMINKLILFYKIFIETRE